MENSLFISSGVTVRGKAGQTALRKGAGVESFLIEDGDYDENQLRVAEPQKFRPGMGLTVSEKWLNNAWDSCLRLTAAILLPLIGLRKRDGIMQSASERQ